MRIKITKEQKEKLFSMLEGNNGSDIGDKIKDVFGGKGSEFNDGYEKGYMDGWLDSKSGAEYNEKYSWNKYSEKK